MHLKLLILTEKRRSPLQKRVIIASRDPIATATVLKGNEQGPEGNEQGPEEEGEDLFDVPEVHREIERRRFDGGLPPTPELYALAREQWYRLPGALRDRPWHPVVGDSARDVQQPSEHEHQRSTGEG